MAEQILTSLEVRAGAPTERVAALEREVETLREELRAPAAGMRGATAS